jgi:hypothetical protein
VSDAELEAAKQQAVDRILKIAARGRKRVFVNFEIQDGETDVVSSYVVFAVVKKLFGGVDKAPIDLAVHHEIHSAMRKVADLAMRSGNARCVTIDVIIRNRTDHDWFLDYSPPPRVSATLRGDLMAEYREPLLAKPYRKYAAQDEWLAQIP